MRNPFTILLTICISTYCIGQNSTKTGCSGMLQLDPITQVIEKTHYVFTGSDTTGLGVTATKLTVVEGRKEMVKKRISKDCVSPNPEDCYVKVLEEIPPVTMNLYTLPNTDKTKEYDIRKEKVQVVNRKGGPVSESIVCPKNRSSKLIKKVQTALVKLGYPLVINGVYDQATALSVTDFQKSKQMAYGDLTLAVLGALDVK
jgi:hypothetical protein